MDLSNYLDIFISESRENLTAMNAALLKLEKNQKDLGLVDEIFRVAHTLKGMSSTMGYTRMSSLTHDMENMMDLLRSKKLSVTDVVIDILFGCLDALESHVDCLSDTGSECTKDHKDLLDRINFFVNGEPVVTQNYSVDSDISDLTADIGELVYDIQIELHSGCMLKGARAFIIINSLEAETHVLRCIPDKEHISNDEFDSVFRVVVSSALDEQGLRDIIGDSSDVASITITESVSGQDNADRSESTLAESDDAIPVEVIESVKQPVQPDKKDKQQKSVRVDISRLDNLMNLVSELIIIKTSMTDSESRDDIDRSVEYLERITTSLHDAVMKVRMVAVENVFNRFPRLVRDLSKELGKKIDLVMSGEDTEVDRTVIDEIGEPLIHLIRNSLDHGIESTSRRLEVGKNETGTVHLRAYPEGNSVIIEIEDDGNGINTEIVKSKAVKNGLITQLEADGLREKDAYNLLFMPGFSTADTVTDISGRGVGLDVVQAKISELGGTVEVSSELGKGSKFTIRLPLTLAILQSLLIYVGSEKYALPLNNIVEIATIDSSSITNVQGTDVVLFRGKTLPLLWLNDLLGMQTDFEEELTIVIVRKGTTEVGLIVSGLVGQQEIVIKSLGSYLKSNKIISGATILGNGEVALIIDPTTLI